MEQFEYNLAQALFGQFVTATTKHKHTPKQYYDGPTTDRVVPAEKKPEETQGIRIRRTREKKGSPQTRRIMGQDHDELPLQG